MPDRILEQELKLSIEGAFDPAFPPGESEVTGIEELPALDLRATYYDTPDLRLARSGLTLRHRTGEAIGGEWTLKLPSGEGIAEGRDELNFEGNAGTIPLVVADLVTAFVRTSALMPVARLRTRRRRWALSGEDGDEIAELVDDRVSILQRGRVADRFREVEIEGRGIGKAALERIAGVIARDGIEPADQVPKLVRALGARAMAPPEIPAPRRPRRKDPAAATVRAALANGVRRVLLNDPRTRLGEAEPLHQMRVGTRRLRSDLKTFRGVVDREWADAMRDELRWLGTALGDVRDLDVLIERVRGEMSDLGPDLRSFLEALEARRDVARERLLGVLRSPRYVALLDRLVAAARSPALIPAADKPASDVLLPQVRRAWRRAARAAGDLDGPSPDEGFHEVRKRTKQARYAAEAVGPGLGGAHRDQAAVFAKRAAAVQDHLGALQDAVVAREAVERFAEKHPGQGRVGFAAGRLRERQEQARADARAGFPSVWRRLARPKRIKWMSG